MEAAGSGKVGPAADAWSARAGGSWGSAYPAGHVLTCESLIAIFSFAF